jgi:hypothetical protein
MVMRFQLWEDWVEFWKTTVRLETRRDDGQEEWVDDGSVDVRGRPVLRTKTGVCKATLFMIGNSS